MDYPTDRKPSGAGDKPPAPFRYHITDHAYAVYELMATINKGLTSFVYLTHDEGSSVGFRLLELLEEKAAAGTPAPFGLTHHFVLDGSIYLPAASITNARSPQPRTCVYPRLSQKHDTK